MQDKQIIESAIKKYKPKHIVALFSGGVDSLALTHWLYSNNYADFVFFSNTGIAVPETVDFIRNTCKEQGWVLKEYKAVENTRKDGTPDAMIYDDIVKEYGFPGGSQHTMMYSKLKERQLARMIREHKEERRDKIMLCSGVRRSESQRRMGTAKQVSVSGASVWVNPLFCWTKDDVLKYLADNNLKINPVSLKLGMSGECLCGAFAREGELERIRKHYPHVAKRIDKLNEEVKATGKPWTWEQQPPQWYLEEQRGQLSMFEIKGNMAMCTDCIRYGKNTQLKKT